LSIVY